MSPSGLTHVCLLPLLLVFDISVAYPLTKTTTTTSAPTTTPPDTTTTESPTPTTPQGCFYKGKHYPPGAEIENGYDPDTNWCYGTYCSKDGEILNWDKWNCRSTTTTPAPITTDTTATEPPIPTTHQGCFYKGKHYLKCKTTPTTLASTTTDTTTTTEPPTPTTPQGCFYKGKHYPPGAEIENIYEPISNWCYITYCTKDGKIAYLDKGNCRTTTSTPETTTIDTTVTTEATETPTPVDCTWTTSTDAPTETTTTEAPTPTTPEGCFYKGKHYPIGAKIENKNEPVEGTTNWCGGCYCLEDGTFECRDNFSCYSTTTTFEPSTTQSPSSTS